MAAPKRRTSKMKQRSRLAAQAWKAPQMGECPECSAAVPPHTACPRCHTYHTRKGEVVKVVVE